MMDPSLDPTVQHIRSVYGAWGLIRFASWWAVLLSVIGIIAGWAWMWALLVLAVLLIIIATAVRRGARSAMAEYIMFHTPEGQQAIRDEAGRMLRDMQQRDGDDR